jgi:hypothetical protein
VGASASHTCGSEACVESTGQAQQLLLCRQLQAATSNPQQQPQPVVQTAGLLLLLLLLLLLGVLCLTAPAGRTGGNDGWRNESVWGQQPCLGLC